MGNSRNKVQTDTFLSSEEMHDLTGYKSPKKQCEQLRNQGIAFFVNARGYPRVYRENLSPRSRTMAKPQTAWQPKI